MNEHELRFIRSFVIKKRQDRYVYLLSKGRREQFLGALDHKIPESLDSRKCMPLRCDVDMIIERISARYSGKTCHVIGGGKMDGMTLDYRNLLSESLECWFECVLSFLPGELALFIHDAKEIYLCEDG